MNMFSQILNFLGVTLPIEGSIEANTFELFLCSIILLSVVVVICLLNVLFYFLIIYLLEDLRLLDSYKGRLPGFVLTIINLYKTTRKLFIVSEICFALFVLLEVIWLCSRVVYGVV